MNDGALRRTLPSPFRSETPGFFVHGPIFFRRSSRLDTLTLLSQKILQVQRFALFADVSASDCASIISAGRVELQKLEELVTALESVVQRAKKAIDIRQTELSLHANAANAEFMSNIERNVRNARATVLAELNGMVAAG